MGVRGSPTGELVLDDCSVPAENLIGEEGRGFDVRDGRARRVAPARRRAGARHRAGRARARGALRAGAPAVRPAASPTSRACSSCSPTWRRRSRRRGCSCTGPARCSTPAPRGTRERRRRWPSCSRPTPRCGSRPTRPAPRRRRLHQGLPGRADDARRQDHPDLRRHEPDPARGDRRAPPRRRTPMTDGQARTRDGSRPRRPDRCTSAARVPRCSTGSTPVITAATFVLRIEDTDAARARGASGSPGFRTRCAGSGSTGTRARISRATASTSTAAAAGRLLAAGLRVRVLLHPGRGQGAQRRGDRKPDARPATTVAAATSTADRARRARRRGPAARRSGSARPTTGVSTFTDLVRGEVSVEWSTISDFVIVRSDGSAGVLPRERGRRPRDGHHPRDPGRGPHRLDAPGPRAARRARRCRPRRSTRTCRSSSAADRRQAVEAARRGRDSRTSATRGYLPEALRELPRAARLGAGATAARCSTRDEIVAAVRSRPGHARRPRSSTSKKLDWLNGEWIRRL